MKQEFIDFANAQLAEINEGKARQATIARMCPECGTFQTEYFDPNQFAFVPGGITVNPTVGKCSRACRPWHEAGELEPFRGAQ